LITNSTRENADGRVMFAELCRDQLDRGVGDEAKAMPSAIEKVKGMAIAVITPARPR
jgi:hypothetical protein